jgi:Concanavalin A-like lectin/glucanases superfamily
MRVASPALLALPLLLVDCGSKGDLVIGQILLRGEAGTTSPVGGSVGAEPTGGALATAGTGGSTGALGGSTDVGGADVAGAAGMAGSSEEDCVAGSEPPVDSLLHRYSFDGTGATAIDSILGADGPIIGPTLDGSGLLKMNGKDRQYVDLPNRIVHTLTDVTIVTWMTWVNGAAYQRVFDFGIGNSGETQGTTGVNYLAVMPKTGFDNQAKPGLGGEMKVPGFPTVTLASAEDMQNRPAQVSFVFKSGVSAALYLDGNRLALQTTAITLADIDDRNNWIGQSQYGGNPPFNGSYEEFRIYKTALDGCQLHTLLVRGPQSP